MLNADSNHIYERVFTVSEYYDGPRQGVANFQGQPHFYDCCLGEDGYTDDFRLTPITSPQLDLALEDWEIWRRWERAYHSGETTMASHPALPTDRARYEQLQSLLGHILRTESGLSITRRGSFKVVGGESAPPGVIRDMEVCWCSLPEK